MRVEMGQSLVPPEPGLSMAILMTRENIRQFSLLVEL